MGAKESKIIRSIADSIKRADDRKTSAYDTQATIRRIEGNTAWVHIPGGVDETPVQLTINASVGDQVQVRVSGGRAFLVGNATAPPTDNAYARQVNRTLTQEIQTTNTVLGGVKKVAQTVKKIADNTNQYFWHTETGTDTGAHITEIPQEDFLADPENGGGNLLARSNGIAVRDGLTELATFSADGECFYVYNVSTGVIEKCFEVSTNSIVRTVNGRILAVLQADDSSHTETLRYFPDTGSTIVVRGSAFSGAHTYTQGVEKSETITCQDGSVTSTIILSYDGKKTFTIEREDSVALQVSFSIAFTYKKIDPYFTLGDRIESDGIGANSCIIGEALSAPYDNQLVIGYANTAEDKAFIIGDGVDETNPKNIFSVDRTGNVDTYGTYKVNGSDFIASETYDLGVISITSGTPGTASGVITKTIEKTGYRPICVKIRYVQASIIGFNAFFTGTVASGDIESILVVQVIRRQSGAASPGYHAYADVTYIKS